MAGDKKYTNFNMKDSSSISIVTVGYNAAGNLPKFFDSLYSQSYKNFEVIFVNNGSTDDTETILKSYPDIKVINNKCNKGFCLANNQAIKMAIGHYVVTLNTDIVLDADFLKELKKIADSSNAGLFGAKILNNDGRTIDSTGLVLSRFYRFFDRGNGRIDKGQYDKESDIFGPSAAAALYKRTMLEDVQHNGEYLDEDFFFLGEDFDLAWRARNKGWEAKFVPHSICHHARNSTNFNSKFRQYLSFRNRYFLLIKNMDIDLRYSIIFVLYDIPRLIYMLLTNKYAVKALREMVRCTPRMLKKKAVSKNTP